MNIVEALKIAKEQGKKVRPVGRGCQVIKYKNGSFFKYYKISNGSYVYCYVPTEDILADWEVVKEKPSKQTQYKIDSMKFQIVRYCDKNADCDDCYECKIRRICHTKPYSPLRMLLDDWSLKEIVEAYHTLKEAGEI
ncbi:hypothetical protein [Peptacetobacter hiranonis]|uniref:Uncharacterized protein n=1 Tax=Peptacetobacter hiranonis (strain DSM 13275 / JCM 10541 / KCTC 15199 / TO-931) TaxID=500633 RepID=B6FZX5_PEPHT|nr:hypothetical protein [Peptacetobacter hiranonis]EEA84948.1 hypothetical protein CLOHIR_01429 [Peptacetobacter hiranonis DSM 13275]QEK20790.1 hypothetical protein KGNDJEFE_01277 [Peptacetobacter hiranonis]